MSDLLKLVADNDPLSKELKDLLLSKFDDTTAELSLSNVELGERTRARMFGRQQVEAAFKDIARNKTINSEDRKLNPAR